MSRYLCMGCWRLSGLEELLINCPDCQTPGTTPDEDWLSDPNEGPAVASGWRQSGKAGRSWIQEWFGDHENSTAGGCELHPQSNATLHCTCGLPLQPRAMLHNNQPLGLGFAGPRSAGKTVMTLAMIRELRRRAVAGHDVGLSGIGDTEERFGELFHNFFSKGSKPDATAPEEPGGYGPAHLQTAITTNSFCWQLVRHDSGRQPAMLLGIYDLAGETWGQSQEERIERFDRYLRLLSSLVFVIDGAALAADLGLTPGDAWNKEPKRTGDQGTADHQWLARIVDRLGEHASKVNLALVISKADLIWNEAPWQGLKLEAGADPLAAEHQDLLKDLLAEGNRRDLLLTGKKNFHQARVFASSSLGFRPQEEDV